MKPESFSGVSSTSGDLCFFLWKIGIIPEVKLSEKCMQLRFFEAFTASLKSICLRVYFKCMLLGSLFQPSFDRRHENNNSKCLAGSYMLKDSKKYFRLARTIWIVDCIVATKPVINVFLLRLERSFSLYFSFWRQMTVDILLLISGDFPMCLLIWVAEAAYIP